MSDRIPLKKAFLWIVLSLICVTGLAAFGWFYYLHLIDLKKYGAAYNIAYILQKEGLDSDYFAEILSLSQDKPANVYSFNLKDAERRLNKDSIFKRARLEVIKPNILLIDYELRTPTAYLGDYTNVAVDEEGIMMPFIPFFTPKNLPKVYLGEKHEVLWGKRLTSEKYLLSRDLIEKLKEINVKIKSIDVSRIDASSYGEREIIVFIEDAIEKDQAFAIAPKILRLSPDHYLKGLDQFNILRKHAAKNAFATEKKLIRQPVKIIDLRIDKLAFIMDPK